MEQRPPRVPKLAWLEEQEEEEGSGAVLAQESEEVQEFQAPQEGLESLEDLEQRPPRVPKLAWVEEEEEEVEEEGPGAAPAPETEEVQQLQPLEEDAAMDGTQEQDTARGRFRRAAQFLYQYIKRIGKEDTRPMDTEVKTSSEVLVEQSSAAQLDLLVETALFNPEQVPGVVRYIHQWLMANEAAEHRMDWALMQVAEAEPDDVAITLLRVAPTCDRAAMAMWTTILLSPWISEEVTPLLINVVGSWPQKNLGTSDGDKTAVFSLTATLVMWKILQGPCCPQILTVYFPRLFVHLLFQTYFSTLYMTEDVHTFWKECQEQHGLSTSPNRFAVQTLKALLCSLHLEHVVVAMERKRGWDTLLCADTHHYAVGLLARVMRRASVHLCKSILSYLLEVLSKPLPLWDVSAMAFLVELLDCLDLSDCGDSLMEILYKYLWYNSTEMHHQVLRALLLLKDRPSMAERIQSLTGRLVHLLWDLDSDVARMSIALLSYIFLDEETPISWRRALQLAEPLLKLLDNPDSQVQLLSMSLLRRMMSSAEEEGRKPLKERVYQSLLPLFFHCQDENRHVAEASRTTLLRAAGFLKRPDLEKAVRKEKLWKFAKLVLADHRIPLAEHLRRALQYLQDPQETLRAAAIRVIGMAGEQLRGQQAELQVLCRALERLTEDRSCAVSDLALETLYVLRAIQSARYSILQRMQDQILRAWRTRPRLSGLGWLRCWRCGQR